MKATQRPVRSPDLSCLLAKILLEESFGYNSSQARKSRKIDRHALEETPDSSDLDRTQVS